MLAEESSRRRRIFTAGEYRYPAINQWEQGRDMKKIAFALGSLLVAVSANAAYAAPILSEYDIQAYKGGQLVLSGTFSILHDDPATTPLYTQKATLQSADLTLGGTNFTLANTGLFRNSSPYTYDDKDLYTLYGIVGSGLGAGTGVGGATDDFSMAFNPYNGAVANLLYANANPAIGGTFADRIVLTPAAAAVPEPATWGMLIVGFGLTGAAMRRRVRFANLQAA